MHSPWSRAAPRNLTSASRRRCRMRRPVPCNRRQWAPVPLLGGLQRDARGLGRTPGNSGAGQAYFPPPEGAARLGLRTAPLPIPTAWSPTEEGDQSGGLSSPWPGTGFTLQPGPARYTQGGGQKNLRRHVSAELVYHLPCSVLQASQREQKPERIPLHLSHLPPRAPPRLGTP